MSPLDSKEVAASGAGVAEVDRAFSNPLLAFARLSGLAVWTAGFYATYMLRRYSVSGRARKRLEAARWSSRWLRGCLLITGVRATFRGKRPEPPALLTPNHLGYLDIMALGAHCETLFVSKAEVESWPVLGLLFRNAEGVGVARGRLRGVHDANRGVAERLQEGVTVCAFLEGTSSGGDSVMPFHASLIQSAIDADAPIVPTAISWRPSTSPIDVAEDVAYWKDHTLASHAWRVLGLRGLAAVISFGDPILSSGRDRKALASEARDRVVALLEEGQEDA